MLTTTKQNTKNTSEPIKRKEKEKNDPTMGMGNQAYSSFFSGSTISSPDEPSEVQAKTVAKDAISRSASDDFMGNMGSYFGRDFGDVNFHDDSNSHKLSRSIQANAFTKGNDVYFGEGQYNPSSNSGQELIAHELTHVVQNSGGNEIKRDDAKSTAPATSKVTNSTPTAPNNDAELTSQTALINGEITKAKEVFADQSVETSIKSISSSEAKIDFSKYNPQQIVVEIEKQSKAKSAISVISSLKTEHGTLQTFINNAKDGAAKTAATKALNEAKTFLDRLPDATIAKITAYNKENSAGEETVTASGDNMQETVTKPTFVKFVDIIQKIKSIDIFANPTKLHEFFLDNNTAITKGEGMNAGKIADMAIGGVDALSGIAGAGLDITSAAASKDSSAEKAAGKGSKGMSVIGAATSSASFVKDAVELGGKEKERKTKLAELGLTDKKRSSHADRTRMASSTLGVATSGVGVASAFTEDDTSSQLGVAGNSMAVLGDVMGMSASGADIEKQRKHNNKAREQVVKLVNIAKARETKQGKAPEIATGLGSLVSKGMSVVGTEGKSRFEINSINFLNQYKSGGTKATDPNTTIDNASQENIEDAGLLNRTRAVSSDKKDSLTSDLGWDIAGSLSDVGSLIGSSLNLAGLDAAGGIVSAIFSTIGAIIKTAKYAKDRIGDAKAGTERVAESPKAINIVKSIISHIGKLPAYNVDNKAMVAKYYATYTLVKSANIDMVEFLYSSNGVSDAIALADTDDKKAEKVKNAQIALLNCMHGAILD